MQLAFRPLRLILPFILGLTVLSLAAFAAMSWFDSWLHTPAEEGSETTVLVEIPAGAATSEIAALLEREGVVHSGIAFLILARMEGEEGRLKAGVYDLSPGLFPSEILARLVGGREATQLFTVPEGLNVEEIVRLLAEKGLGSEAEFLSAFEDPGLVDEFLPAEGRESLRHPLEGYLLPETYRVSLRITPADIAGVMVDGFRELWTPEWRRRAEEIGLSLHEVVTLASIVEAEARVAEERPIIAGVYHNRLRRDWLLQADPTVRYALRKRDGQVLYSDLEVDSPYNTYKNIGLPPGPIGAPGRDSIRAVLYPAEVDYYFFVARADGTHDFSRTLSEHNSKVARYQQ